MDISRKDIEFIELWSQDKSFLNWAYQRDPNDMAKWERYFNQHPDHWQLGKFCRTIVIGVPFKEIRQDDIQLSKSLDDLMGKLNSTQGAPLRPPKQRRLQKSKSWYIAAAITVLFLMTSGLSYLHLRNIEVKFQTAFGEQKTFELPDESIITLNANSKLKYYSKNPRKVWLDGEAFFVIKKISNTNEKFLVLTPDLTVTVLGTSFNINTRNDQTKVFLEEGKVNLAIDSDNDVDMEPGDLVIYSKQKRKVKKNSASVLENSSWKDGTLIFNNTPLLKAVYEIEDIYGIQFVWQSEKLKEKLISGGVPIKDLETTLHILKEVYKNEIVKEGNRYFITEKKN